MTVKYNLEYFFEKSWSFVLMKNGKIVFKSKAQHLKPLIFCIKRHKKEMRGYDHIRRPGHRPAHP